MKGKQKTKLFEWQERCKNDPTVSCEKCGEKRHLTVDHIVPIFILEQFVLDKLELAQEMEENFEILCRYCNSQKASRIDVRNPKTYKILAKILTDAKSYYIS